MAVKDYAYAVAGDAMGMIVTGVPFGTTLLIGEAGVKAWRNARSCKSPRFLDWELEKWPEIYAAESERILWLVYKAKRLYVPQVLEIDNTGGKYGWNDIHVSTSQSPYELDDGLRDLTAKGFVKLQERIPRRMKPSDGNVLGLVGYQANNQLTLQLRNTRYFDALRTHLCLDYRETKEARSIRELLHGARRLEQLIDSRLPNPLGINVLLFTKGDRMIFQLRSRRVFVRPGEYAPSVSSRFKLGAFGTHNINETGLLAEVCEPLGLAPEDIDGNLRFLGLTRELVRGGVPDLFFCCTCRGTFEEIVRKSTTSDVGWKIRKLCSFSVAGTGDPDHRMKLPALYNFVDNFISRHQAKMSIPLVTNIALWVRALEQGGL